MLIRRSFSYKINYEREEVDRRVRGTPSQIVLQFGLGRDLTEKDVLMDTRGSEQGNSFFIASLDRQRRRYVNAVINNKQRWSDDSKVKTQGSSNKTTDKTPSKNKLFITTPFSKA